MQVLIVSAAYGREKVPHVRTRVAAWRAFLLHHQLILFALVDLKPRSGESTPSVPAIEQVADGIVRLHGETALGAGENTADLEHQFSVAKIEGGDLSVRCFLVVIVNIFASGG